MVFECFRDSKCEWEKGLSDFTNQYNRMFCKGYRLSRCLDVSADNRNTPQPEVLLEANDEPSIVVECKKIVYPANYFEDHRKWHTFYDSFSKAFHESLKRNLREARYVVEVSHLIYKYRISEIGKEVVQPICERIRKETKAQSFLPSHNIAGKEPIPWSFRQLGSYECEEGESGMGIRVELWKTPLLSPQSIEQCERYISQELNRFLDEASKKFADYENCIKILVIELCGEPLLIPDSTSFQKICEQSALPNLVDEIWLAEPSFSEVYKEIDYYRMRW